MHRYRHAGVCERQRRHLRRRELSRLEGDADLQTAARAFRLDVIAANDVTVMAFAEAKYGAGQGVANMVCYTLGTGIGGGIVIDHKLYAGSHGMAGELGQYRRFCGMPCNCGQTGCVERYASATGIVNMAKVMAEKRSGDETPFVKFIRSGATTLTSKVVYEFVATGDPVACAVNERACDMLARAIGGASTRSRRTGSCWRRGHDGRADNY